MKNNNIVNFETAKLLWKLGFKDNSSVSNAYLPDSTPTGVEDGENKLIYLAPDLQTAVDFLWSEKHVYITYIWDNVGNCLPSMHFVKSGSTYSPSAMKFNKPSDALQHCLDVFVGIASGKISSGLM